MNARLQFNTPFNIIKHLILARRANVASRQSVEIFMEMITGLFSYNVNESVRPPIVGVSNNKSGENTLFFNKPENTPVTVRALFLMKAKIALCATPFVAKETTKADDIHPVETSVVSVLTLPLNAMRPFPPI